MPNKLTQQELDILQGLQEILDGRGDVVTPEEMKARRRGRPPLPTVKVAVKIRLDADLLTALRESGAGWQTRINEILRREFMAARSTASTISVFENPRNDLPEPDVWLLREGGAAMMMKPYYEVKQPEGAYLV